MEILVTVIVTIILGAVGSLLALWIANRYEFGRRLLTQWLGRRFGLASTLVRGGIARMTLSRADYHHARVGSGTLREYLATAQRSIEIVSVSLNVTQAEGSLISLFKEKLSNDPLFIVKVTLLNPESAVVPLLAKSLDIDPPRLAREILDMLGQLALCRVALPDNAKGRLAILVHDTLPIGSAILLDAICHFPRTSSLTRACGLVARAWLVFTIFIYFAEKIKVAF